MYNIAFYEDRKGHSPIRDYTNQLILKNDKNSRIKTRQIKLNIQYLEESGTRAPKKFVKHVRGEIWELRPLRDRIFILRRGE